MKDEVRKYIPPGSDFNDKGEQIPRGNKVEIPLSLKRPQTMNDRIKELVKTAVSREAQLAGFESFEDANDFDVADPDGSQLPMSPHELKEAQEEMPVEQFIKGRKQELAAKQKEESDAPRHRKVENDDDPGTDRRARAPIERAGRASDRDRRGQTESVNSEHKRDAKSGRSSGGRRKG